MDNPRTTEDTKGAGEFRPVIGKRLKPLLGFVFVLFGMLTINSLYLVTRIQKAHSSMVDQVVVVSSLTPVTAFGLEFVLWLGGSADAPTSSAVMAFAWLVVFGWLAAIIVRALRLIYEIRIPRAIFLVMVFFAIHYGAAAGAPQEQLWYSVAEVEYEADDPYEPYRRIDIETTYRAQRGLLDDVFAGLLPQRGGTTDLYFVGFGSYA